MGMYFQLRDGSSSGIEKTLSSGLGTDLVRVLVTGIENLDRVFFGYIPDKVFSFGSTKVLAAARP